MPNLLHLRIRDRQRVILQKDVASVSCYNNKGVFDILPSHSNFIGIITYQIVINAQDGQKTNIPIDTAMVRILEDKVDVFLFSHTI